MKGSAGVCEAYGEHSPVTSEVHTASTVGGKGARENGEITGGWLAKARAIVEGLLTTLANDRFVMWIA
jgi:hypothetical protein